jgi:hypothetical protein
MSQVSASAFLFRADYGVRCEGNQVRDLLLFDAIDRPDRRMAHISRLVMGTCSAMQVKKVPNSAACK